MKEFIKSIIESEKEHLIFLRRELHKSPELSGEEHKTSEFIENYLIKLGLTPKRLAKTGVVVYLDCDKEETTLLRADIDALPIEEKSNVEYKSENRGVMHACGHDAHVAMLLCTAKVLCSNRDKLKTNVLFVFEPREETDGGAKDIINDGIIKKYNVTSAFGYHVMNDVPVGKIMIKKGALMASPDDFEIKIIGSGGHGALPELCVDPLRTVVEITPKINNITSTIIKNDEKQVVQVCQICSGTSSNIIPSECFLSGTARSFDEEVRRKIPELIENIIKEECKKTGTSYEFSFNFRYPPLVNDNELADMVKKIVEKNFGNIVLSWEKPSMTGDDFSYFAKEIPSLYMFLGTGNIEKGINMPLHDENFMIDEDGLLLGLGVYLSILFA